MAKKREADFNVVFNKYLRAKGLHCYYEIKQVKLTLPYNAFEPQQLESLLAAQENGLVYKFSDSDQRIKPFDGISAPPLPAFVVVKFAMNAYLIPIDKFMEHVNINMKTPKKRSMNQDEAAFLCKHQLNLSVIHTPKRLRYRQE